MPQFDVLTANKRDQPRQTPCSGVLSSSGHGAEFRVVILVAIREGLFLGFIYLFFLTLNTGETRPHPASLFSLLLFFLFVLGRKAQVKVTALIGDWVSIAGKNGKVTFRQTWEKKMQLHLLTGGHQAGNGSSLREKPQASPILGSQ